MFGENPFQDPFLLSREVIKKAYNEGLYFISNERLSLIHIYADKVSGLITENEFSIIKNNNVQEIEKMKTRLVDICLLYTSRCV